MRVSLKQNELVDILLLIAIYVASILIVNPLGNFPLNDDWSYARPVKSLVEQGDWRPTGFASIPLITQSLWGALFCAPAGFSFNALRFSTLTLAILGIVSVYAFFIANRRQRLLALIAALTLGFNPIYYALSATFMTDVPFTVLAILSSIFFVRCIRGFGYLDLSIACVLAAAATLCRQLGVFLPLGFAVAVLIQRGFAARWLLRAILPSVVCLTSLMLFQHWMSITGRTPFQYASSAALGSLSIRVIAAKCETVLLYLGLFCLPILLLGSTDRRLSATSTLLRVVPALFGGAFALLSLYFCFGPLERWMPKGENILIPQGLGPITIPGHWETLPSWFWGIVTVLSVLGGTLLVKRMVATSLVLLQKIRMSDLKEDDIVQMFCLFAVGAYTFAISVIVLGFYDRYFVPLVPFLLYLSAAEIPREDAGATTRNSAAIVLVAFFAIFAVLGTRDYLAWNRVRWEALTKLQQTAGISTGDIDGGYEYIGWFLSDGIKLDNLDEIFGNENAKYRLAFSRIPGFEIVKEYEYYNWMPPKLRSIFVLRRGR